MRGYRYIGIDIAANNRADIVCDAHKLPFKGNTFQLVFSTHVLEHLIEPKKAIKEMYRSVKKGGYVITLVPFMTPFHSDDYWRFSILGLKELFKEFEILDIKVPTHIFTILGHFIGNVFYKFGFPKVNNSIRNGFSMLDKYSSKFINADGGAHSYIIIAKK